MFSLLLLEAIISATIVSTKEIGEIPIDEAKLEDDQRSDEEAVFTLEASVEATIILTIAIVIIILNTLIITSFSNFRGL